MASNPVQDVAKISQVRERFAKKYNGSILDDTFDDRDVDWVKTCDALVVNVLNTHKTGGKIEKAADLLNEILLFRAKHKLNDLREDDLHPEIRQLNGIVFHGQDKLGRPVLHFQARKLKKGYLLNEGRQYIAWIFNQYYMKNPDKPVVFLFDLSDVGVMNLDLDMAKYLVECTATYFPGIAGLNLMFKMNSALEAIWMIIKGWMDSEQTKKTVFVKRKNIQQYIDRDHLPSYMIKEDNQK